MMRLPGFGCLRSGNAGAFFPGEVSPDVFPGNGLKYLGLGH